MYSVSAVDNATKICISDDQAMGAPLHVVTIPVLEFWSCLSPVKLASTKQCRSMTEEGRNLADQETMPICVVTNK